MEARHIRFTKWPRSHIKNKVDAVLSWETVNILPLNTTDQSRSSIPVLK